MQPKACPFTKTFAFLSKKWILLILRELSMNKDNKNNAVRFTELQKKIDGINTKILTLRLKELEKAKLITKQYYKELPPRVEYSLTKRGKELLRCFSSVNKWVSKWK
ncbi:helix-turn-helix transcriptional regulator [Candidatus Woesearchaeota archaeon]|nr:helix-turn-helix transcriptional regulator [Candidatus Woesearchaeota archaeon]